MPDRPVIFTVGHSTRSFDEFVAILRAHRISAIADVRRYPRSRRYPHFNDEALAVDLPKHGVAYFPMKSLGGRRRADPRSPNTGWRNESFRGYADFIQTPAFEEAIESLGALGREHRGTAVMCAEAVPWRCHRSLIADAMLVRGWRVLDIFDAAKATDHKLTEFAVVDGRKITYPAPEDPAALFKSE